MDTTTTTTAITTTVTVTTTTITTERETDAMGDLWLGTAGETAVSLPSSALLRHVMALGSSGSGKTVFCKVLTEAAVLAGVPAICVDPQGDLASLGGGPLDRATLEAHGVSPALAASLAERIEVVVFTPGSTRGIPLSADPIDPKLCDLADEERVAAVTRTAGVVVSLLGYDLDTDDGGGLSAVVDRALHDLLASDRTPSLLALTDHLAALDASGGFADYARYLEPKKIRTACQRLARLDVGARRRLFHGGVPIDIDLLLGRDRRAAVAKGKVRVAVIYLNTLHQQEDKDFFVAALVDRLYAWMLHHPKSEPQALFYIDEVAPFIPPVRKPAAKDGLSLLFKQARKYGVGCVMATQNPGDVDYRAMAQFGTWALGRLTTRQDLKKIEPTLKSLAPDQTDAILSRLPALTPGELVLLSPDNLDAPTEIRARYLVTRHETWHEDRIEAYVEPLRARFAALVAPLEPSVPSLETGGVTKPSATSEPATSEPAASEPAVTAPARTEAVTERGQRDAEPTTASKPRARRRKDEPSGELTETQQKLDDAIVEALHQGPATAKELCPFVQRSESAIRRALSRLAERALVQGYQDGRSQRFYLVALGGRPDLGMPDVVPVFRARLDQDAVNELGKSLARVKVLGLIGDEERFDRAEPLHRLVYKLDFEERVERSLLQRMFGPTHDERVGSVYVHPHNLGVVVFTEEEGIRFEDVPTIPASEVRDFDGVTEVESRAPGTLTFEDLDWTGRQDPEVVRARFKARFDATPGDITPMFVPLWTLYFAGETGSHRRVLIDALVGKPTRWLPPNAG